MTTEQANLRKKCWNQTTQAVKYGRLVRPAVCSKCGRAFPLQAHHADYVKPLEVFWVCRRCHNRITRFLAWFEDCIGWLEHCKKTGTRPEEWKLPIQNPVTGAPHPFRNWFWYWKWKERNL